MSGGLLIKQGLIRDDIISAEPREIQHGRIEVTNRDITANLPYAMHAHLCFNHHVNETVRVAGTENLIIDPNAPSAAHGIYDYFGGPAGFPNISQDMVAALAQYSEAEVLAPADWTLLNFILDPRTGLNRHGQFAISDDQLMRDMMVYCRRHTIGEILDLPDVRERTEFSGYRKNRQKSRSRPMPPLPGA